MVFGIVTGGNARCQHPGSLRMSVMMVSSLSRRMGKDLKGRQTIRQEYLRLYPCPFRSMLRPADFPSMNRSRASLTCCSMHTKQMTFAQYKLRSHEAYRHQGVVRSFLEPTCRACNFPAHRSRLCRFPSGIPSTSGRQRYRLPRFADDYENPNETARDPPDHDCRMLQNRLFCAALAMPVFAEPVRSGSTG